MICSACFSTIPDNLIACQSCAIAKSIDLIRSWQHKHVPAVKSGRLPLRIFRSGPGARHILMFESSVAFCGCPEPPRHQRDYKPYGAQGYDVLCGACRYELQKVMEREIPAAATQTQAF